MYRLSGRESLVALNLPVVNKAIFHFITWHCTMWSYIQYMPLLFALFSFRCAFLFAFHLAFYRARPPTWSSVSRSFLVGHHMNPPRLPSASVTPIRRPHLMVCSKVCSLDQLSMNARTGTRDQSSASVQQSYQVMGTCIVASHEYSSSGSAEVWESWQCRHSTASVNVA